MIEKIISKEEINTGRQIEFDITKTLSVFFMVLIHTWIYLSTTWEDSGTASNFIVGILCSLFGASLFMICMGIGFDYTKNKDNPSFFIKRGLIMFILAYVLNITRSFIDVFITTPILYGSFQLETLLISWFNVDIMQFAGLALMVFGLFKKCNIKPWNMFIIAVILSIISTYIPMFTTHNGFIDLILGAFVPNSYLGFDGEIYSCFPLITYLVFPMFGYAFGIFYRRIKNKSLFYAFVAPVCGIISIGYGYLAYKYKWPFAVSDIEYYHMSFYNTFICILAAIFIIGVYYYISLLLPKSIHSIFTRLSSNINRIYCAHWVILYNLYGILSLYLPRVNGVSLGLNESFVFVIGVCIYIVSVIIATIYTNIKKKKLC